MPPTSKARTRNKARTAPTSPGLNKIEADTPTGTFDQEPCLNALLLAVAEQNLEKLADCISKGHDLHETPLKGCTPLLLAVKLGNYEMVKLLVQNGASCCSANENGPTVLHHAAVNGLAEIVKCLVEVGGAELDQLNVAGCTPLYQAVQHGHIDCVRAFLTLGAKIEARTGTGATPLYIASDRGNLSLASILLHAGADANVATELQMTPLLVAAFNGHQDVVCLLLAHKVDIEQRGPCGGTALYVAAQEGRRSLAECLLQHGAKVDARCDGDLTPSLIAAMQGHDSLVRLLLEARGDLGVRSEKGSTLAIMAARHGQTNVLKTLVEIGGSKVFDGQNIDGLSASSAAKLGRHPEASSYIKSVAAAQKEADLNAWEANLPGILQELDPPSKKKTKAKSKHKGKANGGCVSKSPGNATVESPDPGRRAEDSGVADATNAVADDAANVPAVAECSKSKNNKDDKDCVGGGWMQVSRKGIAKPMLAIALPESPSLSSHARPAPMLSPIAPLLTPGPVTPMSAQSSTVTPMSAQSSTACGTTSPFGLRSVVPVWPSTPEFWPQFTPAKFKEEGLGFSFWPGLPPAMIVDAFPEKGPSGLCMTECLWNSSPPYLNVNSALSIIDHCQSVCVAL